MVPRPVLGKETSLLVVPSQPRPLVDLARTWEPLPPLRNLPGQQHQAQGGDGVVIMSGVGAPGAEVASPHNLGNLVSTLWVFTNC